jgi:hypothetical protein
LEFLADGRHRQSRASYAGGIEVRVDLVAVAPAREVFGELRGVLRWPGEAVLDATLSIFNNFKFFCGNTSISGKSSLCDDDVR